jgi:DHA1 family multidrug resistance protein-like MFS transporter
MKKKGLFLLLIISFNLAASYAHPITPTYFKWLHLDNAMF